MTLSLSPALASKASLSPSTRWMSAFASRARSAKVAATAMDAAAPPAPKLWARLICRDALPGVTAAEVRFRDLPDDVAEPRTDL